MRRITIILGLLAIAAVSCQKKKLPNLEETIYVRNDNATMPAYVRGNGASNNFIILIHGGPGGTGLEYDFGSYSDQLEKECAMVYWDQRGQGMSQGVYPTSDVTIAKMVEDLRALILVVKKKYGNDINVFLLGHSWGGTLGTAFMTTPGYQQMVNGWIEADGAHDIPKLNVEAIKLYQQVGNEQILAGNSVSRWDSILGWANSIDTNFISTEEGGEINSTGFATESLLQNDGVIASSDGGSPTLIGPTSMLTAFISGNVTSNLLFEEVEAYSATDMLSTINIPTLVLWGKYDFVVPPALGYDTYNKISSTHKKLVIFEESGHSPMDTEADKFVIEVLDFVEAHAD